MSHSTGWARSIALFLAVALVAGGLTFAAVRAIQHHTERAPPLDYAAIVDAEGAVAVLLVRKDCEACARAKAFLDERGVPVAEKDIRLTLEGARLLRLVQADAVPVLIVRETRLVGFDEAAWSDALGPDRR